MTTIKETTTTPASECKQQPPATVWAIRKCESLDGPAIFTNRSDCIFYVEEHENEDGLEWKSFSNILEAVNYVMPSAASSSALLATTSPPGIATAVADVAARGTSASTPAPVYRRQMPLPIVPAGDTAASGTSVPTAAVGAAKKRRGRPRKYPCLSSNNAPIAATPIPAPVATTPTATTNTETNREILATSSKKRGPPSNPDKSNPPSKKKRPRWDDRFEQLREFKSLYGSCDVLRSNCGGDVSFYYWVRNQRRTVMNVLQARNAGKRLQQGTESEQQRQGQDEQETAADDPNSHSQKGDASSAAGDSPRPSTNAGTMEVSEPTKAQAAMNNGATTNGEKDIEAKVSPTTTPSLKTDVTSLVAKRADKLLELGLTLSTKSDNDRLPTTWEDRYKELKEYIEENDGSLEVKDNRRLERWIMNQQNQLAKWDVDPGTTSLNEDRRQRLLHLGLKPESRLMRIATFDEMYEQLVKFKEAHGHVAVPNYDCDMQHWSGELRSWTNNLRNQFDKFKLGNQKNKHSNCFLTAERIRKLTQLGFRFEVARRQNFDYRAAEWFEYFTKYGKDPPHEDSKYGQVGVWCGRVRRFYWANGVGGPSGPLTQERIDKLKSWGFDFNRKVVPQKPKGPVKKWEQRYQELVEFKEKHGHVDVPQQYPELGTWVHHQRRYYRDLKRGRKSLMTKEKIERLVALGFKWITRKSPRQPGSDENGAFDFARYERHQNNEALLQSSDKKAKARRKKKEQGDISSSEDGEGVDGDDESSTGEPLRYHRSPPRGKQGISMLHQQAAAAGAASSQDMRNENYALLRQNSSDTAPWDRYCVWNGHLS